MTYTTNDLLNLRAMKADAETKLAELDKAHTELVTEIRSKDGDTGIFAKENASRIEVAVRARREAAEELTRLNEQEHTVSAFLGDSATPKTRDAEPTGPATDWARQFANSELMEQFRKAGLGAVKDRLAEEVFTRDELVDIIKTRAFDAAAGTGLRRPDYKDLMVDVLVRRPRLADFVTVGTTDTDMLDWVVEGAQTNNAGYAAYGTNVSESAYSFTHTSTTVSRIMAWISATDGQLRDASQTETLLRTRLVGALNRFVEQEVFAGDASGTGEAKHLEGFSVAAAAQVVNGAGMTPLDAILEAAVAIESASLLNLEANAVMIHPVDYKNTVTEKDADGRYQIANPTSRQIVPLWGLTPIVTPIAVQGSPWVGDFTQFMLWVREGLSLSVSDNVGSNFLTGIKVIKGELRLAGKTIRPEAFRKISNFGA